MDLFSLLLLIIFIIGLSYSLYQLRYIKYYLSTYNQFKLATKRILKGEKHLQVFTNRDTFFIEVKDGNIKITRLYCQDKYLIFYNTEELLNWAKIYDTLY